MNLLATQLDTSPLSAERGIGSFRQGEQDQLQQNQRNLLKDVGGQAATGNYLEAAQTAMKGGDLDTGLNLVKTKQAFDAADTEKRLKLLDFFGRGAAGADTPEKWDTLINMAQGVYGQGADLSSYRDFNTRGQVMQFLASTKDQLEREKLKAETEKIRAQTGYYRSGGGMSSRGYQINPETGAMEFIPGGPADPQTIAAQSQARGRGRQFSVSDIKKLTDEGATAQKINEFTSTFKPDYAGYGFGGETAMSASRLGLPFTPSTETAEWWQGYDRYKNVIRNELFGSALTAQEKAAFEAADINPNMSPDIIKANLQRQQRAAHDAMMKNARALIQAKYDPGVVADAYGIDVSELTGGAGAPGQAPRQSAVPPGAIDELRRDPSPQAVREFEDIFGPGSARQYLGGR